MNPKANIVYENRLGHSGLPSKNFQDKPHYHHELAPIKLNKFPESGLVPADQIMEVLAKGL